MRIFYKIHFYNNLIHNIFLWWRKYWRRI